MRERGSGGRYGRGSAPALLVDFGSTYTKVTALDLKSERVIAASRAPTTVAEGMTVGLRSALRRMTDRIGSERVRAARKLACSSAAGGLRMVAVGLVAELTAEAARRAALGAGARVLRVFSGRLQPADVGELSRLRPEVILLAGGTDGGNREILLHNARRLAEGAPGVPVVLAGNREAVPGARAVLASARPSSPVRIAENVMPRLGTIEVESAREEIRALFMESIVDAKGLRAAEEWVEGVLMPTPAAVLRAAELLSKGTEMEKGLGALVVVDVGGATTDVHSLASGRPRRGGTTVKGLPEPYAKRTVEGDLGMRVSAAALCESVGVERVAERAGLGPDRVNKVIAGLTSRTDQVPEDAEGWALDRALASFAVEVAVGRHVGTIERVFTPHRTLTVQRGKDLTQVGTLIGTGGVLVHHPETPSVLRAATQAGRAGDIERLIPLNPALWLDHEYMLSAMGLLSEIDPTLALRMMKRSLQRL